MWLQALFALLGAGIGASGLFIKRWAVPKLLDGGSPAAALLVGAMPFLYLPLFLVVGLILPQYLVAACAGLVLWTLGASVYLVVRQITSGRNKA